MIVEKPSYKVTFAGRDITADISPFLQLITYTDKVAGECDEIELTVENSDGLWSGDWYPQKGDTVELTFGISGTIVSAGVFEIDEIELSGPPHVVNIRGLATGVTSPLRTRRTFAYEDQTLKAIAEKVAERHGLTVMGEIETVQIERTTQNRETDLGFLSRIACEYGYIFSLRGKDLVFTSVYKLEASEAVTEIDFTDLIRYSIRDKTSEVYTSARNQYHNPNADKLQSGKIEAETEVETTDVLETYQRVENDGQAELKAKASLHAANSKQQSGNLDLPGQPILLAGSNFDLTGMGALSGTYHIISSTHTIDAKGGYVTGVEIKRVGFIVKSRWKPKRKRKTRYKYTTIQ